MSYYNSLNQLQVWNLNTLVRCFPCFSSPTIFLLSFDVFPLDFVFSLSVTSVFLLPSHSHPSLRLLPIFDVTFTYYQPFLFSYESEKVDQKLVKKREQEKHTKINNKIMSKVNKMNYKNGNFKFWIKYYFKQKKYHLYTFNSKL